MGWRDASRLASLFSRLNNAQRSGPTRLKLFPFEGQYELPVLVFPLFGGLVRFGNS